jgi:hypothetical protein
MGSVAHMDYERTACKMSVPLTPELNPRAALPDEILYWDFAS